MDIKALAERIRDYILKRKSVTMTELYALGKGRYSNQEMNSAMREIHKMKTISRRMKGGDVVYTPFVPKVKKSQILTSQVDPVYRKQLEKEYNDMCNSLTPEQSKRADTIMDGVGAFIWIGNSLVPKSNSAYYNKVLKK